MASQFDISFLVPSGERVERDDENEILEVSECMRAFAMQTLARQFPCLREIDSIDPWDVVGLAQYVHRVSEPTRQAILFILSVWSSNSSRDFGLPQFSLPTAMAVWDGDHIAAYNSYARDPWGV